MDLTINEFLQNFGFCWPGVDIIRETKKKNEDKEDPYCGTFDKLVGSFETVKIPKRFLDFEILKSVSKIDGSLILYAYKYSTVYRFHLWTGFPE